MLQIGVACGCENYLIPGGRGWEGVIIDKPQYNINTKYENSPSCMKIFVDTDRTFFFVWQKKISKYQLTSDIKQLQLSLKYLLFEKAFITN